MPVARKGYLGVANGGTRLGGYCTFRRLLASIEGRRANRGTQHLLPAGQGYLQSAACYIYEGRP